MKRSLKATAVPKSAIAQATSALQTLSEKPKEQWSLREAIEALHDVIVDALDKGYDYPEIATLLREQDIRISPSSLKSYLSRSRKQQSSNLGTRRRTKKAGAVSTNPQAVASDLAAEPDKEDSLELDQGNGIAATSDREAIAVPAGQTSAEASEGTESEASDTPAKSTRRRSTSKSKTAAKAKPTARATSTRKRQQQD
jgi:hypothetical protein